MTLTEAQRKAEARRQAQAAAQKKAEACLSNVELQSFAASPSTILPFGESTLTWSVKYDRKKVQGCMFHLTLNGVSIADSGSWTVGAGTYVLRARVFYEIPGNGYSAEKTRTLGVVTVIVDTNACFRLAIAEDTVRQMVLQQVLSQFPSEDGVVVRRPASVEIDENGIHIFLKLKIVIENFSDLNLDVRFKFTLAAVNGNAVVSVGLLSVDIDFPWWMTVITQGVSKIVEEVVEHKIKNVLRSRLVDGIRQLVELQDQMLQGYGIHSLVTDVDVINVTICPRP